MGLLIHFHLHKVTLSRNTLHADGNSKTRQRNTGPAKVTNRRIGSNPIALRIVKFLVGRQATIALLDAAGMQTDHIRLLEAKSGVIGLNARPPDQAVIRADQQVGMCIHRQEKTTTATIGTVVTNIVIGK